MAHPEEEPTPTLNEPTLGADIEEEHQQAALNPELAEIGAEQTREGRLDQLRRLGPELVDAIKEDPDLADQSIMLYTHQEKGRFRGFMRNRGPVDHVEAKKGWVIHASSAPALKKSPAEANLFNSGLGVVLTEDGKLHLYLAQHNVDPLPHDPVDAYRAVQDRFQLVDRNSIGRRTFTPKDEFRPFGVHVADMPEQTTFPRYRPEQDRPTLLLALDDPENELANDYVIGQCYEVLADFVHQHLPLSGNGNQAGPTEEQPTSPTQPAPGTVPPEGGGPSAPTPPEQGRASREQLSDEEKMDQWFDEGVVSLMSWLKRDTVHQLDAKHKGTATGNQFTTVYNDTRRAFGLYNETQAGTSQSLQHEFSKEGFDELLTVSGTGKKFAEIDSRSPKADEQIVMLAYETTAGIQANRRGNAVQVKLFLPESEAAEALGMIYENPERIRDITNRFIENYLGLDKDTVVDYENLPTTHDGKRRLAFRKNFFARPDEAMVREF